MHTFAAENRLCTKTSQIISGVYVILSNGIEVMTTNVDEWWEETARQIRTCGEEICGRSSGKKKPGLESWWWNEETEKAVKEKKDRLKTW